MALSSIKHFVRHEFARRQADIEKEILGSEADGIENILRNCPVYIFCLSAMPNQLSQWRAYSGPTGGFAIGFKASGLTKLSFADNNQPFLERAVYKSSQRTKLFKMILEKAVPEFENYLNAEDKEAYFERVGAGKNPMEMLLRLLQCFSCFNDNAFQEEKEYRLVCLPFFRE